MFTKDELERRHGIIRGLALHISCYHASTEGEADRKDTLSTARLKKNKYEELAVTDNFGADTMKTPSQQRRADVERLVQGCFAEVQCLSQRHEEEIQRLKAEHSVELEQLRGEVGRAKIEGLAAHAEIRKKCEELVQLLGAASAIACDLGRRE
ncbi:uncharacterized protein EKO05_0004900 [Ascochyta rabiei]|uniref:uncharacterized protein n=1 Tax=Didymella rabiei TaxID=5454 RepID=UPI00220E7D0C|nr:uncharacterized protein EKO05_0004900 [Ascochyta rabiei]UPX14418.1 hypothetical protein EKO05_0004900 [Ascochyta rabiei]